MERKGVTVLAAIVTIALALSQLVSAQNCTIGIGIVLNTNPTAAILSGSPKVWHRAQRDSRCPFPDIPRSRESARDDPRSSLRRRGHSRQRTAGKADRHGIAHQLLSGLATWDLDAVNVANRQVGPDRTTSYDGTGVYVAVLTPASSIRGGRTSRRSASPRSMRLRSVGAAASAGKCRRRATNGSTTRTPTAHT